MTLLGAAMGLWWCAVIAILLGSAVLAFAQPYLARQRERNRATPAISVLAPLRTTRDMESLAARSIFSQDYPAFEVLFSVAAADSTAVRETTGGGAGAPSPSQAWRLIETPARPGFNPKIANLIEPMGAASHDFLLIKDAGTVLPCGTLAAMMRSWGPGTGLVCAVPILRAPSSLAARVEAALVNTYGARLLLAMSALGGGAGIGAAMLLRRSDLAAAGGLQAVATAIADDHALAKALRRQGLRTVFAAQTVDQCLGMRSGGDVWRRHLRWAVCRRLEEPLAFFLEPLTGLVAACVAAFLGAGWLGLPVLPLLAATLLLWPLTETALAASKGWPAAWPMPAAILLREAAMPALWLAALVTREIAWGPVRIAASRRRKA